MQWCSTCDQKPFAQQVQLLPSSSVKRMQECLARSRQIADALAETSHTSNTFAWRPRDGRFGTTCELPAKSCGLSRSVQHHLMGRRCV
jgi:hypothetical protein